MHETNKSRKENILKQTFPVSAPNEACVSDVTIFEYYNRKYYICVVLDLYARKAISHAIALNNSTQLTKQALINAYNERKVLHLIQNSIDLISPQSARLLCQSLIKYRKSIDKYPLPLYNKEKVNR